MQTTLITGASSGIGEVFARKLAARKENLLLVARSEDKLANLCNELGRAHEVNAQFVAMDLSEAGAGERLYEETLRRGLEVETLINNAGFGSMGDFTGQEIGRELNMIDLNVKALVDLTYRFLLPMRERKRGAIINVASTASFQPVPFMSTYAATKAFVLSFSEALWEENRPYGIKVLALCPGVTETNFFEAAQIDRPPGRVVQTPEAVVETALGALERGKGHVVSGWANYLMIQAERLVPRSIVARAAGAALRPQYGKKGAGG
ncbi:MAG TPA: SDR family oxidoreductase [Pyrinomonadaceae bacterium]|jgi:short-subunit dehydrogenase|nr:SDR family oxidoreductase [Pyrinomonadaceae bacterium]